MTVVENDEWQTYWENESSRSSSDFEFDRGMSRRSEEIERLFAHELLQFIRPQPDDEVLDAGCGSGANIALLHDKVKRIVGIDYSRGAVARCAKRIMAGQIMNVEVVQGEVTSIPVADKSMDKVLCLSVLQYLTDDQVRQSLAEFSRVLRPGGTVILHVKNIASLHLGLLWMLKKLKRALGGKTKLEYFRSCSWYFRTLAAAGFEVFTYNSFNALLIEGMPKWLIETLQKFELQHYKAFPLRLAFVRRHGADLKIRATKAL